MSSEPAARGSLQNRTVDRFVTWMFDWEVVNGGLGQYFRSRPR